MKLRTVLAGGCALFAWQMAFAGPLATDPDALLAHRGTTQFTATSGSNILKINVDYAVFAPGAYPDDNIQGTDPSHGRDYVYAFQAFNVSPCNTSSCRELSTIGLELEACSGSRNLRTDPLHGEPGGLAPSSLAQAFYSITIDFLDVRLAPGQHSQVIILTSPNSPAMTFATIQDGGAVDQQQLPTPISGPHIPFDLDWDCDVDLNDYGYFEECVTGPAIHQVAPDCKDVDFDQDGDVDHEDFGFFQRCFSGKDRAADATCLLL